MMKHAILSLMTAALLGVVPLSYADVGAPVHQPSVEEVRQKMAETAEAIKAYGADKRDEAAKKAKAALDMLDARIETLEEQSAKNYLKMDKAARERSRATMKVLHAQRVKVAEWYGGLKNSSADAWEEMRRGFMDAYKSLQRGWEKAEQAQGETEKKP